MKRRKVEDWQAKLGTTSFDPLEIIELQDAVKSRQQSIELDGRKFGLKYEGEYVYYHPLDGSFAPAGRIKIQRLLEGI